MAFKIYTEKLGYLAQYDNGYTDWTPNRAQAMSFEDPDQAFTIMETITVNVGLKWVERTKSNIAKEKQRV